jgi:HAE1 family hydrophobic/amphiphilic exporter-1
LLTLVVVPVIYCYLDDLSAWLKRRLAPRTPATGQGGALTPAK